MTTISTATQRGVLASFALLLMSIMLSAQAQALALEFDDGGFSYTVIDATTEVMVTGRAAGNTATDIVIPDTAFDGTTTYSVTNIGNSAFFGDYMVSVVIPDSVTEIWSGAFSNSTLASVTIGNGVKTIGHGAFGFNGLTTSVTIPASVTEIGIGAFEFNSLTSVAFLGNYGRFMDTSFRDNGSLATITYAQGATGWDNPQRTFTPRTGPTGSVTATAAPAQAATPVPTSPIWLLGMMAGLLSLVAVTKPRKA